MNSIKLFIPVLSIILLAAGNKGGKLQSDHFEIHYQMEKSIAVELLAWSEEVYQDFQQVFMKSDSVSGNTTIQIDLKDKKIIEPQVLKIDGEFYYVSHPGSYDALNRKITLQRLRDPYSIGLFNAGLREVVARALN